METKKYQYEFSGDAIGPYRQHTIYQTIEALDPDGFISDGQTGDTIIDAIEWGDMYVLEDWQDAGENKQRRLVWENESASENDDGYNAIGEITRTLIS